MSTPNFALKNASRYFVFGMPVYYTQEDIAENGLDQDLLGEIDELGTEFNYDAATTGTTIRGSARFTPRTLSARSRPL